MVLESDTGTVSTSENIEPLLVGEGNEHSKSEETSPSKCDHEANDNM